MHNKKLIISQTNEEVYDFITSNLVLDEQSFVTATNTLFNIENLEKGKYNTIINLKRVNEFKLLNTYLRSINRKLPENGIFVSFVETYSLRKQRLLRKYPMPFNWLYYTLDFLVTRVSPKISFTKKLYYYISAGKGLVLSRTEVLGRLHYCGFEIVEERNIKNKMYFIAKKVSKPLHLHHKPSTGFVIKLPRVGKNGKLITVYKFRTMHPYSEYIQHYVYQQNNLQKGGKLKNDFRISTLGAFFRKYWIDELPMIYNWLKGDLKLIGVRPLSKHYLSLYNDEVTKLRLQTKPGLLPPFYADMPETLEEIQDSEKNYLQQYSLKPWTTDIRYLFKILHNIIIKKKRSK